MNDNLFIISIYSNKLFLIDKESLKLKKTIEIVSDYSSIGTKPLPIDDDTFKNMQELDTKKAKEDGYIARLYYDNIKKEYNVLVYTSDKGEVFSDSKRWPFTVIILDEKFNKKREVMLSDGSVMGAFSVMTDKGLMFYSNMNSNDRKSSAKEFFIYNF